MRADPLPPRFCQNTGGYLWQLAEYLGADHSRTPLPAGSVLARPRRTELPAATLWPAALPPETVVRRAAGTDRSRPPAPVLAPADQPRVLLVCRRVGAFAELPPALAERLQEGVSVGELGRIEVSGVVGEADDLLVGLVRHGLLTAEPAVPPAARSDGPPTAYRREPTAQLTGGPAGAHVVNRLTGRALRLSEGAAALLAECGQRTVAAAGIDPAVLRTFAGAGILRPVPGGEREA